ncbi:peptidylprolyl isomerase [Sphingomonas bacterium]|uniref:peptidylprolyl isomerase n=1 Tax=Sphingomonas bacterium TaxID=1895847 RepID=UPI0020C6F6B1|nr:peptidylprolyl isomerase [Sphingomonas bacterium]
MARGPMAPGLAGVAAVLMLTAVAPAQTAPRTPARPASPPAQSAPPPAQSAPDQAQTVPDNQVPETGLDIPANLQIFGKFDPNVRKATAIVNDSVITGTDVDQRVGLIAAANNLDVAAADRDRLKLQILRQLIDETLQIQEAKTHDISVTPDEIGESYDRVAKNFNRSPGDFGKFLKQQGSSERSIKRQIEGELAWNRYLRRRIEPTVNVSEQEVTDIIARLEAAKGTVEYHLREIYIRGEGDRAPAAAAAAEQVMDQVKTGKTPFETLARQFSDSTTKNVGGDLDWIRLNQLPDDLAHAAQDMQVGQIAGPIAGSGGFSILYLVDKRQVLTADPRDAKLNLKQLTVRFPPGTGQAEAAARAATFSKTTQAIQGCGSVDKIAASIGAEVVNNDTVRVRDLPPQLQDILLKMQVGQSSPPFGSPQDGVRALVLCGRDDPVSGATPNVEAVQDQIQQQRVNLRAQQTLRDLRRDAIIEYR